jgi:methyl-accepting chemotaxis protein
MPDLLHPRPIPRARQWRWVLSIVTLVLATVVIVLGVVYQIADTQVSNEFFRAHKTIHPTGELLRSGILVGGAVLLLAVGFLGWRSLHVSSHIVRPIHLLHEALDGMAQGDLGVRVVLHRHDEFQDVADSLNKLVDEFSTTLQTVHSLVDQIDALAGQSGNAELQQLASELDRTMDFFKPGKGT